MDYNINYGQRMEEQPDDPAALRAHDMAQVFKCPTVIPAFLLVATVISGWRYAPDSLFLYCAFGFMAVASCFNSYARFRALRNQESTAIWSGQVTGACLRLHRMARAGHQRMSPELADSILTATLSSMKELQFKLRDGHQ